MDRRDREIHDELRNIHENNEDNYLEDNSYDDIFSQLDNEKEDELNDYSEDYEENLEDQDTPNRVAELRRVANERLRDKNSHYLTDDEIAENAISAQRTVNKSGEEKKVPNLVKIMGDPVPESDLKPIEEMADPGDTKKIRIIGAIAASVVAFSLILALAIVAFGKEKEPETTARGQSVIAGEQIESQSNSGQNPTSTSAQNSDSSTSENVSVPRGGSKISYEIEAEGEVKGVSLSWIDGNGVPDSQVDASLPFKKIVGAKSSVSPMMKANSSGYGTLTCTIKKNGKKIAEETVSGDSPTIECSA